MNGLFQTSPRKLPRGAPTRGYRRRRWSVRHARLLEISYTMLEPVLERLAPLWRWIGHQRVEKPMLVVEGAIKSFLFDCQMCGQCVLSETGMSCPMNCPKSIRNGPCGGVRADGNCEVIPEMPCVWVQAVEGRANMQDPASLTVRQKPLDYRKLGHSSWLDPALQRQQTLDLPAGPMPARPLPGASEE